MEKGDSRATDQEAAATASQSVSSQACTRSATAACVMREGTKRSCGAIALRSC